MIDRFSKLFDTNSEQILKLCNCFSSYYSPPFFHLFCFSGIRFDLNIYRSLELVRYFFTIKLGNILLSFVLVVGLHYQVCIIVIVIWVTSTQGSCFSVLCIRMIVSLLKYSFKTQSCISYLLTFLTILLPCAALQSKYWLNDETIVLRQLYLSYFSFLPILGTLKFVFERRFHLSPAYLLWILDVHTCQVFFHLK